MELHQFFWLNQQKEHLTEIIQNAENLTFGSGTANTAPAHPILPLPTHSVADPYTFQIFSSSFFLSLKTDDQNRSDV